MLLWTMQPHHILEKIQKDGIYTCDSDKISMPEFTTYYDWLAERMGEMIGPPPSGIVYPVWAWYIQDWKQKKPDLRRERWAYGPGNEDYDCIELELSPERVVLSDFDAWSIILLDGLISDSEEENAKLEAAYDSLMESEKLSFKHSNWDRVFDISPFHNDWTTRGKWVQATFWELRKEDIRRVYSFRTAAKKM